jgi:2-dehydropantoate 2-reductase
MKLLDAAGPGQMSSLAVDIIAGRPSELDHLVGPILRLARQAAIPTPTYDRIYAALLPQDLRARASPPLG